MLRMGRPPPSGGGFLRPCVAHRCFCKPGLTVAPIAYFLTWTTYGSWLPGDSRGYVDRHRTHGEIIDAPDPRLQGFARKLLVGDEIVLDGPMRRLVREAILEAVSYHGWAVHALQVRSNHVHIVISAADVSPGKVMGTLKARASRALNDERIRRNWWTREGSKKNVFTEKELSAAIEYVQGHEDPKINAYKASLRKPRAEARG